MGKLKPINIKNRTYYFCDIIHLDEYDGSNITVDKKKTLMILLFIILAMNIRRKFQNAM